MICYSMKRQVLRTLETTISSGKWLRITPRQLKRDLTRRLTLWRIPKPTRRSTTEDSLRMPRSRSTKNTLLELPSKISVSSTVFCTQESKLSCSRSICTGKKFTQSLVSRRWDLLLSVRWSMLKNSHSSSMAKISTLWRRLTRELKWAGSPPPSTTPNLQLR